MSSHPTADRFVRDLLQLLDAHGVEYAMAVVCHPDHLGTLVHTRGDMVWRTGAWVLQRSELCAEWTQGPEGPDCAEGADAP